MSALIGGVILLRDDGAALLQHRDDKPGLPHAGLWVPPGGHCDQGESLAACAAREFLEETGYACQDLRYLTTYVTDGRDIGEPQTLTMFWDEYDGRQEVTCREGQALEFVLRQAADHMPIPRYLLRMWDDAWSARERARELLATSTNRRD